MNYLQILTLTSAFIATAGEAFPRARYLCDYQSGTPAYGDDRPSQIRVLELSPDIFDLQDYSADYGQWGAIANYSCSTDRGFYPATCKETKFNLKTAVNYNGGPSFRHTSTLDKSALRLTLKTYKSNFISRPFIKVGHVEYTCRVL